MKMFRVLLVVATLLIFEAEGACQTYPVNRGAEYQCGGIRDPHFHFYTGGGGSANTRANRNNLGHFKVGNAQYNINKDPANRESECCKAFCDVQERLHGRKQGGGENRVCLLCMAQLAKAEYCRGTGVLYWKQSKCKCPVHDKIPKSNSKRQRQRRTRRRHRGH